MFDGFVRALEVAFKGFDMRSLHKMKFAMSHKGEVRRYKILLNFKRIPPTLLFACVFICCCVHIPCKQCMVNKANNTDVI